ncbi:MAG TPA: hypothetical protein VHO24_18450 [Opitutaceae bacterium]|nr:hypothetical protein [Opitutaceae bacterium]
MPPRSATASVKPVHLVLLLAVMLGELLLFRSTVSRDHAWMFPRWDDQLQYLNEAYAGYEHAQEHGFIAGATATLTNISAQGALHDFWALLGFTVLGPSRDSALALNLLAFFALQAATFFAVRRLGGSTAAAWVAIAFLAALHGPWSGGSASVIDFRLDWMAACAYGIALAAAVTSGGFRSTRPALLFGLAVGFVVLTRYLTAAYFVLIYAALFATTLFDRERGKRCGHVLLSALVALAVVAPFFWHNRQAILAYYWVGHIDGPERALRGSQQSPLAATRRVLSELTLQHVGIAALILFAIALLALGLFRVLRPLPVGAVAEKPSLRDAWKTVLIFFAAPLVVLSLHTVHSSPPVSIVLPAVAWLVVLGWLHLAHFVRGALVARVSVAAVAAGMLVFGATITRRPSPQIIGDAGKVNALADYFYFRAEECGLSAARISVTRISDELNAASFQILGYERHQRLFPFLGSLPTGLFETPPALAMQLLADSDFVCLVTSQEAMWPFDRQMIGILPEMRAWCETHLRHVSSVELARGAVSIYERPTLARPGGGSAVNLTALLARASPGAGGSHPPPAPPLFPLFPRKPASAAGEYVQRFPAAYSPASYRVTGLPPGFRVDPRTGVLRGKFPSSGFFTASITATNSLGSATSELSFDVRSPPRFALLNLPDTCVAGTPVEIRGDVFDVAGKLNYIDVIDLTAGRVIDRVSAGESETQTWHFNHAIAFSEPGPRSLLIRIVCFDAREKQPYTFFDEPREINVAPR